MKHIRTIALSLVLGGFMSISLFSNAAYAAYDGNRIIDDVIFDNASTMSTNDIDNFLNSFGSSCISTNHGFSAPDLTGYTPSGSFTYGGLVSAGKIIAHASQVYGINPQVLLATLQKEQSLVTGGSGCDTNAYTAAVGYGCPDSGTTYNYSGVNLYAINGNMVTSVNSTCVNSSQKAGFSQQLIRAAWLLKFGEQRSEGNINWAVIKDTTVDISGAAWNSHWDNSDDPQSCYSGPMTQGTWQVCPSGPTTFYDGYRTIDGTAVHIETGSTAALYWYTPHFHGNQNFQNIFNGWFGTTLTSGFVWQPQGQNQFLGSDQSTPLDPGTLVAGQRYFLTVSVRNAGAQTWRRGNVNLGTSQPQDRTSPFRDNTWLTANRAATINEATVAPGQTGTFSFWIQAPSSPGYYKEYFNLVAEGVTWMNDMGLYFDLQVNPAVYSWQPVSQNAYTDETKASPIDLSTLAPGVSAYHTVTIRNTGNVPWYRGELNLGTSGPRDRISAFIRAWPKSNRAATINEATVAPGQTATFEFWTLAPNAIGSFREYFTPVADGHSWMTDYGLHFLFNVNPPVYRWQPVSQNTYTDETMSTAVDPNNITPGARYYIAVTVQNIGNEIWKRGVVNLGTSQPQDRTSPFRDNTWFGPNRPATMSQNWIGPGQNATFGFWAKAPTTPGTYKEYYNVVADGTTWMNDMGLHFQYTVH
jgi:hypothetical protein